jgi:hypothetical protein
MNDGDGIKQPIELNRENTRVHGDFLRLSYTQHFPGETAAYDLIMDIDLKSLKGYSMAGMGDKTLSLNLEFTKVHVESLRRAPGK